jgi:hypothetical protein
MKTTMPTELIVYVYEYDNTKYKVWRKVTDEYTTYGRICDGTLCVSTKNYKMLRVRLS